MKTPFLCILWLAITLTTSAQLKLPDIAKIAQPLEKPFSMPTTQLMILVDTLEGRGIMYVPSFINYGQKMNNATGKKEENSKTDSMLYFESVDTTRKETVQLCAIPVEKGVLFEMTVRTRDLNQYNNWLKSARGDTDLVTYKSAATLYDQQFYNSLPAAKEKQTYAISEASFIDPKKKRYFVYQVTYSRLYIPQ